jgi:hypothetical protein
VENKQIVAELLWQEFLGGAVGKRVDVSLYATLRDAIPDKHLIIQEVVDYREADEVSNRFEQYLADYCVFPILGTLGGNVLCIGISETNRGVIYYYDFDFGLFELNRSTRRFMDALITVAE